jgi:hypothetical protein
MAAVAAADQGGITPFLLAAEGGSTSLLQRLWAAVWGGDGGGAGASDVGGALLSARDRDGMDALARAEAGRHLAAAALLRQGGADEEAAVASGCPLKVVDASEVGSASLRAQPLLVRDATAAWPARRTLTRPAFLEEFGAAEWLPQYLLPGNATRIGRYLEQPPRRPLVFNRPRDAALMRRLRAQVGIPAGFDALAGATVSSSSSTTATGLDFFVGARGAGLPMHYHSGVWNALLWGSKLWALLPPSRAAFAPEGQHPLDASWYSAWESGSADAEEDDSPLFCVQEAGDAIFLPSGWAHATVNLEESLGVGGFVTTGHDLGLHMQLLHAPRGVGSLQTGATLSDWWRELLSRAFPAAA